MTPQFREYVRHLSKQDRKNLTSKTLKTVEEVGELAKVVLPYENAYATTHRFVERERILEEAVDTVLCALSVAYDLDFTDEEIDAMMVRKAEKWNQLQINESEVKYPLPYEVHLTVKAPPTPDDMQRFRELCATHSVKPIILDLEVMTDVMTSSHHFGTNRSAYEYCQKLSKEITGGGFPVIRAKIETVPWHPAAPKLNGSDMPPGCYFEAHIPITVRTEAVEHNLRNWLTYSAYPLHLSRNPFKRTDDGSKVIMLTMRDSTITADTFKAHLNDVVARLSIWYELGKVHTEFAVYDTNVSHDAAWINAT